MHSIAFHFSFVMRYGALGAARSKFEKNSHFYPPLALKNLSSSGDEEKHMLILWEEEEEHIFEHFGCNVTSDYDIYNE